MILADDADYHTHHEQDSNLVCFISCLILISSNCSLCPWTLEHKMNLNFGDIAPDENDVDGLGGADKGSYHIGELNVTALGHGKVWASASGANS